MTYVTYIGWFRFNIFTWLFILGLSGNQKQLRVLAQPDEELVAFMNEEVAAALGVSGNYDEGRQEVVDNFKNSYLNSAVPLGTASHTPPNAVM